MKYNYKTMFVFSLGLWLFTGCSSDQPSFDPNKKGIVVVEGKPYRIPLEANYSIKVFANDKDVLKLRKAGVDCKKGDISWISSEMQIAAQEAATKGDMTLASSIIMAAPRKRQIGCAHPLSKKEFEYYRSKQ